MRYAVVALLCASALTVSAQAPAFDVVSIKEAPPPGTGPFRFGVGPRPGGRWVAESVNLVTILRDAYPGSAFDPQIVGGPAWVRTARFDINAVAMGDPSREQVREMVKRMLAERFGLKVRTESRQLDVYLLVPARPDGRLGPNIKTGTLDCEALAAASKKEPAPASSGPGASRPERIECGVLSSVRPGGVQRVVISSQPLSSAISMFQSTAGRPVIDRSNLRGATTSSWSLHERRASRVRGAPRTRRRPHRSSRQCRSSWD